MKLWEKAKEKYPALSRADFIQQSCPTLLRLGEVPEWCRRPYIDNKDWQEDCIMCWDRGVGE